MEIFAQTICLSIEANARNANQHKIHMTKRAAHQMVHRAAAVQQDGKNRHPIHQK
jgi:hypothetical protein